MYASGELIRVLHVDDDPDFAATAGAFLEREGGFDVETAGSASAGLERLADDAFDCVVSDYDMPGTNGIEFLESVRRRYPELPFILYTGKGGEEVASDAISAGVTDYLQKESGTTQYTVLANRIRNSVEKYHATAQLADRERRLSLFFEQSPLGVIEWDKSFDIVRLNDSAEEILGYDEADLAGRSWEAIVPETERDGVDDVVADLLENEGGYHYVNENVRKNGERVICEWHNRVVTNEENDVVAIFSQFQDITDRKRRSRAIEELHTTTDVLMEAATAADVAEHTVDAARDILDMPATGVHLYDEDEDGLVPVAWTDEVEAVIDDLPTFEPGEGIAGTAFETQTSQIYGDISSVPERYNPDTDVRSQIVLPLANYGVLLIGSPAPDAFDDVDVSLAETLARHATTALERIDRESELLRRQELFEAVVETSIDGILVVDENREYVTWNQQFLDLWGMPDELVGDVSEEVGLGAIIEQLEHPQEFIDKVEYLYEHPHEESREQIQLADGRVFDRYSAPVEADDGTYFGRVWFFRDITEAKQHERELTRQNERLEKFTSVVSHDLRNPLTVAQGRLELAREECNSTHLDSAATAVDRSITLIDDLLTLAHEGEAPADVEAVHLGRTCTQCWETVDTSNASVVVETERTIRANPSRLKQLLENLLGNAVEHGSDDVTVTIGDLDDGFYIADDGSGISAADREQVFDAGYSTTPDGTGFGLSIVQDVADAHDWEVEVTESADGGARFEIRGVEPG